MDFVEQLHIEGEAIQNVSIPFRAKQLRHYDVILENSEGRLCEDCECIGISLGVTLLSEIDRCVNWTGELYNQILGLNRMFLFIQGSV